MKNISTDRNLLFGMFALNNEYIVQEQLLKAFQIWVYDKNRSLADILGESGWMNPESIGVINQILDQKINQVGGESNLLENMPDDLCILHTLANSIKDEDILRATANSNAYFTQTLRIDAAKSPESASFFKLSEIIEKTAVSLESPDIVQQPLSPDPQKTIQNSDFEPDPACEATIKNSTPLSPVDATVPNSPVFSSHEEPPAKAVPKSVEKRIEFKTEFLFSSPADFLGSGSFGIVYRSVDSEFKRKVALKCLKPDHLYHSLTPTSFLLEAEINGKLDHPGVLPMYGLGYTDDDVPFYVMKMIDSPDLDKVIKAYHQAKTQPGHDQREIGLQFRKLIEHLKSVCLTMQYAHDHGVLHCDLKPQNIMTGEYGETYVVDWGSALLVDPVEAFENSRDMTPRNHPLGEIHESRRSALHQSQGGRRNFIGGSLAYMAPEHRDAHEKSNLTLMTPACDVFSLGVVFYQILTGKLPCRPFDREDRILQDRRMKKADYIPPGIIVPEVSKVLSAICMKALAPDFKDRYASAKDFAKDLENWQAGEPVSAYRENFQERTTRWAKRNRTTVSVIASSFVVITLFSMITAGLLGRKNSELANKNNVINRQLTELARQNVIIERREKMAVEAVKQYADAVSENEQLKNREELEDLRKNLLKAPIEFFRRLNDELRSENDTRPDSVFSLSEGITELAHLTDAISDRTDARNSYAEAVRLLQELSANDPANDLYRARLASALTSLGLAEAALGNNTAAGLNHRKSIEEFEKMIKAHPNENGYQNGLAGVFNSLGNLERDTGNQDEARNNYQQSIALRESLVKSDPNNLELQNALARSLANLSYIDLNLGKLEQARTTYNKSISISESIVKSKPEMIQYRDDLALALINTAARDLAQNQPTAARDQLKLAIFHIRAILEKNPTMTKFQMRLAQSLIQLGILELNLDNIPVSRACFSESSGLLEELVKGNPGSIDFLSGLAFSRNNLGQLEIATNNPATARTHYERSIENYETLLKINPDNNEFKENLASVLNNLGGTFKNNMGETLKPDLDAAQAVYARAIQIRENLLTKPPVMPDTFSDLAGSYDNMANVMPEPQKAIDLLQKAIALQSKALEINVNNIYYQQNMVRHCKSLINQLPALSQSDVFDKTIDQLNSIQTKFPQIKEFSELKLKINSDLAFFLACNPESKPDDYNRALKLAKDAFDSNPDDGTFARSLGAAYYRTGQFDQAKAMLEKSTELNKSPADGRLQTTDLAFLAMTCWKLNQKSEAESRFKLMETQLKEPISKNDRMLFQEAKRLIDTRNK